jgi:murein DD-endopeptidase MepM/ murein hydrolase activator NlpD
LRVLYRIILSSIMLIVSTALLLFSLQFPNAATLLCQQWNSLYERIQYGSVDRRQAGKVLRAMTKLLRNQITIPQDSVFYFPLEDYGPDAIGGQGSGYVDAQYDFLHGNAHRGHPANDLFIHDDNEDGLDDRTHQPVYVVAMTEGIVVAFKDNWVREDTLRGGNYLVLYNPRLHRLYYYAHNGKILVRIGDRVRAGSRIATVGRTGKNAFPQRSPTHLHLMVLQITEERNKPYNFYSELVTAKRVQNTAVSLP